MKSIIFFIFSMSYIFSLNSFAKFSGIPIQVNVLPKPTIEEKEPERVEEPIREQGSSCMPPITIAQLRALLTAYRIDAPLSVQEEDGINELVTFFRQMASQDENRAYDLSTLIRHSGLNEGVRLNLEAAVILGKLDGRQTIGYDNVDQLKEIAKESVKLTYSTYRDLKRNFSLLFDNSSRSLRDDLRNIQFKLSKNRSSYRDDDYRNQQNWRRRNITENRLSN